MGVSFNVEKVAQLAYLELSSEEKARFEKQFEEILAYVDQLQEIPMTDEETKAMGAFHVQTAFYEAMKLQMREKLRLKTEPSEELKSLQLSNSEATRNAPKASGLPDELLYEVPSIMES